MEGSLAKLPEIVALAKRYDAVTIVDDSHGTGVMGKTGRGTIEHFGLEGQVDILTGTLGKALGGAAGGFVAGSDALDRHADPALADATVLQRVAGDGRVERARGDRSAGRAPRDGREAARERALLPRGPRAAGFKPLDGPSAIVPIIVGETAFAIAMSDRLLREGIFVTGFGFPVVPEGTARVRVQISAALERARSGSGARGVRAGRTRSRRHRRGARRHDVTLHTTDTLEVPSHVHHSPRPLRRPGQPERLGDGAAAAG